MADQANELRELVRRTSAGREIAPEERPRFIAVAGGRDGVGTTTVAISLAIEASRSGRRVLLVDADTNRGDIAERCRLSERYTVADVLAARKNIREAIQPGPAGIWALAGGWAGSWAHEKKDALRGQFYARIVQPLEMSGDRFDLVVFDAGNGASGETSERWQAADTVVLVTTADLPSIMDTYAAIKQLKAKEEMPNVHCLINMADERAAADVYARLERSCRRFLGLGLKMAGHLPLDAQLADSCAGQSVLPIDERLLELANC